MDTALDGSAFALESGDLALELHRLLAELDRSRFRWKRVVISLPERLTRVRASLSELARRDSGAAPALRERVIELKSAIEASSPSSDVRAEWLAFRAKVVPAYEALAASLRDSSIHVPSLRPKNYVRNAYHVANAAVSIAILELVPSWTWAIAIAFSAAAAGWTMEISRRASPQINEKLMKLFGAVAHPHEAHRINSATWYVSAIAAISLTREIIPCALALATLGLGDPIAAIVGRRWGRIRIVNGRSVEGTTAFIVAATLGGIALLMLVHHMALGPAALVALAASTAGAIAELYSRRIDDNLSIPVLAWVGASLALWALG